MRRAWFGELAGWLRRTDPDLVLSDWGDEEIIPTLWHWSREYGESLPLDREANPVPRRFRDGAQLFFLWPHRLPGIVGPLCRAARRLM